jgi:nicotinamidase-related amidase
LLVIDAQRTFVRAEDPLGQVLEKLVPGSTDGYFERVHRTVLPNIQRLLETFRARRLPVFFTCTGTCTGDGRDLPGWLKDFDELGLALIGKPVWAPPDDPTYKVDESVSPQPEELVLHKSSSGPLATTRLDQILHNMGITGLVVTGLTTDVCVAQTARETADRGFNVIIAEDACTTLAEELHRAALETFSLSFGRVKTTEELVRYFAGREKARAAS